MIRFNCSHCVQSISVKDEHAGKRGKCPACRQPVSIPSATAAPPALPSPKESSIPAQNPDVPEFEWPNFNADAEGPEHAQPLDSPPLPLSVTAPDVRDGSLPGGFSTIQLLDPQARVAALAAVFGLVVLAVSPLFKWMNFGSGGMIGLKVGGGTVLGITLVAIGICIAVLINSKWLKAGVLLVQAWGTVAVFWMAILIWRVGSVFDSSKIKDNPFAGLFAMQSGPGAGLYLGLIGGLVVAAALGFVAVRCLLASGSVKPYLVTQGLSVAFGIWWVFSVVAFGQSKDETAETNGPDLSAPAADRAARPPEPNDPDLTALFPGASEMAERAAAQIKWKKTYKVSDKQWDEMIANYAARKLPKSVTSIDWWEEAKDKAPGELTKLYPPLQPKEWYRAEWTGGFSGHRELDFSFTDRSQKLKVTVMIRTEPQVPIKELEGHLAILKDGKIIYEAQLTEKPDVSFIDNHYVFLSIPYDDNNPNHRTLRFAKDSELTPVFTVRRVVLADGTEKTFD